MSGTPVKATVTLMVGLCASHVLGSCRPCPVTVTFTRHRLRANDPYACFLNSQHSSWDFIQEGCAFWLLNQTLTLWGRPEVRAGERG